MSLSSLIVERGIASIREIEEALARQVLYGGDLVTNLLEVSRIEESALMPVVAESFGLPMAPNGELPRAPEGTAHVVAAEVAAQHGFAPLTVGVQLVVAVAAPLTPDAEQELSFALAMKIQQRIAPIFRIRQALARDFGVPFDKRTARLIQKIVLKGPRIASTFPPPMDTAARDAFSPPRPPSRMPPPPKLPTVAPVTVASAGTLLRNLEAAPPASLRPARRRRGPLTLEAATTELEASAERDAVFDILFEFARQFFDYTVLFGIHGEAAEGRDAFGDGLSRDKIVRLSVPVDAANVAGNVLGKARQSMRAVRAVPAKDGLDAVLMTDLGRDGTTECGVFPVVVRRRVVAILFGDGGASGLDDTGVKQVERLVIAAAGAFERVIVRRKLKAGEAPPEGGARAAMKKASSVAPPPIESAPPIRLSTGPFTSLDLPIPILPRIEMPSIDERPSIEELAPPIRELLAEPPPISIAVNTMREPTPEIMGGGPEGAFVTNSDLPPPANLLAVRFPSGAPIPREEPKEGRLASVTLPPESTRTKSGSMQRAEALLLEFGTPSMPSVISENGFGGDASEQSLLAQIQGAALRSVSEPPPQTTRDGGPPSLEWPLTSTVETEAFSSPKASSPPPQLAAPVVLPAVPSPAPDEEFDPDQTPLAPAVYDPDLTPLANAVEPVLDLAQRKGAPPRVATEPKPMPASEQQVSVPAHKPPQKREPDAELPSVIVDVAEEYAGLVERVLAGGDEEAETDLLRAGGYAMPAIMAKFPGPITIERERLEGPLPRIAEVGPILRLIAGQRRTALPFVVGDVTSLDPERRFWATYLLTELAYPDAVEAAVGRVFDENARVRKAARTAVRALAEAHPAAVVAQLQTILKNERKRGLHVKAVEALGESREPTAIPLILPLLDGTDAEIAAASRTALVTISRQDFNLDVARWTSWWEANKGRHRLEWLIDSLMHEHRSLRGAASEELRALTKEFFGYYDDLPKRERAVAQGRYREWWENIGKVRFSRAGSRGG